MRNTNTNKTGSDRRDGEVAALILIESTLTGRLPTRYGNLTVDEQRLPGPACQLKFSPDGDANSTSPNIST